MIWQLQHQLCDAATFIFYLQNKFQWTSDSANQVHWKVHQLANQHLLQSKRQIISKFIHEWLPLLDRYHVQSSSANKQCPSCQGAIKTVIFSIVPIQTANKPRQLYMTPCSSCTLNRTPPQYYNAIVYGLYVRHGATSAITLDEEDAQI